MLLLGQEVDGRGKPQACLDHRCHLPEENPDRLGRDRTGTQRPLRRRGRSFLCKGGWCAGLGEPAPQKEHRIRRDISFVRYLQGEDRHTVSPKGLQGTALVRCLHIPFGEAPLCPPCPILELHLNNAPPSR